MQKETKNWFASWFDSPYYHILYKDRNHKEAASFMENLTSFLKLPLHSKILDLACGKGRHAQYLHALGYDVVGVDLSPKSIEYAKQYENKSLYFEVHDMSLPYPKTFDAIFNLFTSFGYFENETDNLKTLKTIKASLKPNGIGVIDFLNVEYVEQNLVPSETKMVEGIVFYIRRKIENGYIVKNIKFSHNTREFEFTERVKAIHFSNFLHYFETAGITLLHSFGDYDLTSFSEKKSKRLILIFK